MILVILTQRVEEVDFIARKSRFNPTDEMTFSTETRTEDVEEISD